jgi:hypothetical protein
MKTLLSICGTISAVIFLVVFLIIPIEFEDFYQEDPEIYFQY